MEENNRENLNDMFEELENVIRRLETEENSLENSFKLYSEGMELIRKCSKTIDEVEKKVLILDENGETHEF